ncbi:MAG TPA: zinc-binding dehydrogenase [Anaerolineales bacterium]|jgi:L-iditol 2-dehydrogenase
MKTLRLHGLHDLRLHDEPIPVPGEGQLLLRVGSVGICGSDLHWFAEQGIGDARLTRPLVLGHEFSALTEKGERVAVEPAIPCGHCEYCLRGHPNLCPSVIFAGHGNQDGALREFMAWDEHSLFPLPDSLSNDDGAMLEPLGVAIHSVDLGHLKAGMTVGVFGCGVIGLLIVQLAKLSGATNIVATDILPHRVEAARALGAHHAFLAEDRRAIQQVLRASAGRGVDVAFEVAGDQDAVEAALATCIPGGKLVLVGIPSDDKTSFPASVARRKGLTIKLVRRMKHTYPRAISLVESGLVDVRSLVTHRFSLDQAAAAFEAAERREGIKIMIEL